MSNSTSPAVQPSPACASFAGNYLLADAKTLDPRTTLALHIDGSISGSGDHVGWFRREQDLVIIRVDGSHLHFRVEDPLRSLSPAIAGDGGAWALRPLGDPMKTVKSLGQPRPIDAILDCIAERRDASLELSPAVDVDSMARPSRPEDTELLGQRRDDFLATRYTAEAPLLHVINDATLFNGVTVANAHGAVLWDTAYQAELRSRRARKAALETTDHRYLPPRDFVYQAFYPGTSYLFNTLLGNYGHWHVQSLCSAAVVDDLVARGVSGMGLVSNLGMRFEPFRRMTMPPHLLSRHALIDPAFPEFKEAAYFDQLLVPSFHRIPACERFHPIQIRTLRRLLAQQPAARGDACIYVSRADIRDRRTVTNESQLAGRLADLGFEIVIPGTMNVAEQHALFCRARLIVGPHGGGLTNMLVAPNETTVFELFHERQLNSWYRNMACILGFEYHYSVAPVAQAGEGWSANFTVDIDHCVAYAKSLM